MLLINQSINQSVSQSVSQSISWSISQSVCPSVNSSVCLSVHQSVSESIKCHRKREHVMPKHALIGCQTWHDCSSNIWSLADCSANFRVQSSAHEIDPDLCQYAHAFCESGFTSSIAMKYWQGQDFQSFSERKCSHCSLLNFKCLMTNHTPFSTQLDHVSASHVQA